MFCCAHAQQIQSYIKKSDKWTNSQLGVFVKTIEDRNAKSIGDVLRTVHDNDLIRGNDFVLIAGDVISNIDLKSIIATHRYDVSPFTLTYILTIIGKEKTRRKIHSY